jgi:class 3 adenylate cyclase/tetratricopeptide (TPR) repeat protein
MLRKTVTLVFCDVTGSTALGEARDPEAVRGIMSRYFDRARTVLERHGGTVEKFVGDAVMAAFGIPEVHEDDALRAVRAAAELRDELAALNVQLERDFGTGIGVRIGVNTGEVIAGDPTLGQDFATGDAVIVAQRLEAAAVAGEILLGDATHRLVRSAIDAEAVTPLAVRGRAEHVPAWRLLRVTAGAHGVERLFDSPLVGRAEELARLREAFGQVVAARACRVVTVLGEAGVGKSRLVSELAAAVDGEALVLEGRCLPYGRGITYWPVVEVVRAAAGVTQQDAVADARAKIAALLEEEQDAELVAARVADIVGLTEHGYRSEEISWAMRRLLECLSRRRPLLVVLDDVQWAEPLLLDMVEYLAGWTRSAPILICCLARPDLLDVRPAWHEAAEIRLQPLPQSDARVLGDNVVGRLDDDAAAEVARLAEGNPLFVEELVRMLVDDGSLQSVDGGWRLTRDPARVRVPATIQAVLTARLDRLPAAEREVLQRAAVIGQEFWWGAVTELSPGEERQDVAGHLHALVRRQLIYPHRGALHDEDSFRFGHILVRDTVYDTIPKRTRADLHERFAAWLDARAASGLHSYDEIVGYHLEQAYRYRLELGPTDEGAAALASRAADRLAAAGRRALARADAHAAVSLLERAAAIDTGRLELRHELAVAQREADDLAGSLATLDALLASSPEPRVEWSSRLERAFVRVYMGAGSVDDVLATAEEAAAVFDALEDEAGLAQTWAAVGIELFWRVRVRQMESAYLRALEHARRAGDERREWLALNRLCVSLALGDVPAEEASARCRALLGRAEELAPPAVGTAVLAGIEAMCGRVEEGWLLLDRAREMLGERASRIQAAGLLLYAEPLLALDAARAARELRAAYTWLQELGERAVLPTVAAVLAEALLELGDVPAAEELTVAAERLAVPEDVYTEIVWRRVRSRVVAGRGEDGRGLARAATALARETESPHILAGALVALGEVERALAGDGERELVEALALYEAKGNLPAGKLVRAALDLQAQTR